MNSTRPSMCPAVAAMASPAAAETALEEITVTARKRAESVQEIPIAITAFCAERIQRTGEKSLEELSVGVAGLQ